MPELPEVETVCRGLDPVMAGQQVEKIVLRRKDLRIPFPQNMNKRLVEGKITHVSRRAKYIFVHVIPKNSHEKEILIIHLGMSGQVTIVTDAKSYKPFKHDHMIVYLKNGAAIVLNDARRFGMVMLENENFLPNHSSFSAMGPEPLDDDFTAEVLRERLKGKTANIKNALLDQHVVAGIGNIYASEALFQSHILPMRDAGDLSSRNVKDLVASIKNVLNRAIAAGGSTLKDYKKADGSLGYFQHSFAVYGREGEACPNCPKSGKNIYVIQKIILSGRATYFCPNCQS